jgi:hypothetical protein
LHYISPFIVAFALYLSINLFIAVLCALTVCFAVIIIVIVTNVNY